MLCPHCGVKGAADDSYRGKMVKCPKCETVFEVFPEEKTSVFEGTQASATLSPVESETLVTPGMPRGSYATDRLPIGSRAAALREPDIRLVPRGRSRDPD